MAHTAPPTPTRRPLDRIAGVVVVLVGIVLAIITITALHHPKGRQAVSGSIPPTSSSAENTSAPSASRTASASASKSATASSSAASTAAARFTQGGWTVTSTSTFTGDILSTAVYYDPDVSGSLAAANALQAQFPAIQRVKPKFDGLPSGPIVVVLTSDYS